MDTRTFLSCVLPEQGYYCLAVPLKKGYKHFVTDDLDEMTRQALAAANNSLDVYFAVAALREKFVLDREGRKRYRVKTNIRALRAVILDVDVAPNHDRKYASREEALAATSKFFGTIGWPEPLVVGSGNGLHLYVLLEQEIAPDAYRSLMAKLAIVAQHCHYKLDPACTDVSRVLRVVGTYNFKSPDDPKPVQVLRADAPRIAANVLEAALDRYIEAHQLHVERDPSVENQTVPDYLNCGDNLHNDLPPIEFDRIQARCEVLRNFADVGGRVSYKYWFHALQVIRFCENGRSLAHELSSPADNYDKVVTDDILDDLEQKAIRPTLCATFASLDETSAFCARCAQHGRIKTPATLGRDFRTMAQAMEDDATIAKGEMPPPPWPFRVDARGVVQIIRTKEGEDEVCLYPYPLRPIRRVFLERQRTEALIWQTITPSDGDIEITIEAGMLYDKKIFAATCAAAGIYVDPKHVDGLRAYMVAYAREVQRLYSRELVVARVGWRDEFRAFAYGDTMYLTSGEIVPCRSDLVARVHDALKPAGTLEGWRNILRFYEHTEFAPHQFALGTAFGSVLMPFTGLSGGIINIVGQSGEGKSTIQKVVNSVWGHPVKLMLPAEANTSTYNAKISFINQMNNLPICAEEITNAPVEEIGTLAYTITQGSEKWRAGRDGQVRDSSGGWCTTMLSSSNTSLHEKLYAANGSVAKTLRIFEFYLPHVRKHSHMDFHQGVNIALMDHYGVAGKVYLQHIIAQLSDVRSRLINLMRRLEERFQFRAEERIWSALIATNLLGLQLAQECGLVEFNLEAIWDFVRQTIERLQSNVDELMPTALDLLSRYVHEHISDLLVVESQANNHVYVAQMPRAELQLRYDVTTRQLSMTVASMRKWCQTNNVGYNEFLASLKQEGVAVTATRLRLGSGTDIPSTQARSLVLDLAQAAEARVEAIHSNVVSLRRSS